MDFIPHTRKQGHFLKTIGTVLMKDEIHICLWYSMPATIAQIKLNTLLCLYRYFKEVP